MSNPSDETSHRRILVVDDEKNIRLTLSEVLRDMGFQVDTAADGEEALIKLEEELYWLMLLDLKMPGLGGMDVLRGVRAVQPEIHVIIITAHGTVDSAVEAMKLGAVDFLPKPFSPQKIRTLVGRVMEHEKLDPEQVDDYEGFIELARHAIAHQQFDNSRDHIREALRLDEKQPEAHNLLGILHEIAGDLFEAQQRYRKALEVDPTFAPARTNLQESVEPDRKTSFFMGEVKKIEKDSSTS